jgi:AcrR family transcriptional regulator
LYNKIVGEVKPAMPRPYRLGQRQATTEQTRARILSAAREVLMSPDGYSHFSIDAVARQADVARMTVYHQFGSKIGLLEGLCDTLAVSGGMEQMATVFQQPEPLDALNRYLLVFSRFWEVDRLVMRRLRALAALDPDFEQVIRTRDEWRRRGVSVLAQRFVERQLMAPGQRLDEAVAVLFTLSSFETFDTLAGPTRSLEDVAPLMYRLARAALGL